MNIQTEELLEPYYVTKLKDHLCRKQQGNSAYSLRAYSEYLGIHSSTLSQVFKGKRNLPLKRSIDIAQKLKLSPREHTLFLESFYRTKTNIDKIKISHLDERFILDESYFRVIAEWEHYAVLELFKIENLFINSKTVVDKLGVTRERADVVLNNLLQAKLICLNPEGALELAHSDVKTTEDIKSMALQKSHKETLEIGMKKLEEIEVELRDFSSSTLAIDLNKISEAKTIIREFRQKMTSLLRDGNKTEVYQLAIQFYPLSKISISNKEQK
jgi:uncharacterized protein (TIGR02147 family)